MPNSIEYLTINESNALLKAIDDTRDFAFVATAKKFITIFLVFSFFLIYSVSNNAFGQANLLSATDKLKNRAEINRKWRVAAGILETVGGVGFVYYGQKIWNEGDSSGPRGDWGTAAYMGIGVIVGITGVIFFFKGLSDTFFAKAESEVAYEEMMKMPSEQRESFAAQFLLKIDNGEKLDRYPIRTPDYEREIDDARNRYFKEK